MKNLSFLLATICFASSAQAQGAACPIPDPEKVDPCVVGFWVGDNDAAETINAQLCRLVPKGVSRSVVPAMPAALAMIVTPGGAYVTMPFAQNHAWIDEDEESMTLARMAIAGSAEAGYLTATGGTMTYCQSSETVAWMELGLSNTLSGAKEIAIPIKPAAAGGFRPDMRYTCSPNYLQIDIKLPPPINNVQYRLGNVGAAAFGEYYSAAVLERLRIGPTPVDPNPLEVIPVTPEEVPLDITPVEPVEVPIPTP